MDRACQNNTDDIPSAGTCRLCGAAHLDLVLRLENAPANVSYLLRAEQIKLDQPITLEVMSCRACSFVQIAPQFSAESFYSDYLMTTSHSAQMQDYQERQAQGFVERFGLQGKRVLEVGCGDGNYLCFLKKFGAIVFGIEPSTRFRKLALACGFPVHDGYMGSELKMPGAPFEAFVARQVLEHVPNISDFLLGIRKSLSAGAIGLIEVPSLEQTLAGGRFYDFFADHVNYFTERTLRVAVEKNGFEVIEIAKGMNDEYNIALVRLPLPVHQAFPEVTKRALKQLQEFTAACKAAGKRVAVWGAGGKGISAIAIGRLSGIAYVIDSDPFKQGLFTPVSHLPVVSPAHLAEDPVDAIILTALAYKQEILAELRGKMSFAGEIAILAEELEVLRA